MSYSIDSVQATLANTEGNELLEIPEGSPVLEVERTTFSEHGRSARFNKAVYRRELFKLVVTNTQSQATSLKVTNLPAQSEPINAG
jgi:DNA-binding GntR family transcriptional regulator